MTPVRFEPTISAGERPQIYALDCAATVIGTKLQYETKNIYVPYNSKKEHSKMCKKCY